MNVSLTPELEAMVKEKVESGRYASSSEVIREALRIMEREEKKRVLIEALNEGYEQIERGETIEFNRSEFERIMEEARANAHSGRPVNDLVKP